MNIFGPFTLSPPFTFGTSAPSSDPLVVDNEVANWLSATLGVEVYPMAMPQGTADYPCLVYTVVDGDSPLFLAGESGTGWVRYQIEAYSNIYADAALLTERLRLAVAKLIASITPTTPGTIGAASVLNVVLHRHTSGYDPTGTGQDNRGMYRRMSELTVYYVQAGAPAPSYSAGYFSPSYFAKSYFPAGYFGGSR